MIVADILTHQALQMAFIENDDMVEQIAAAVADEPFSNTVLPRTAETGSLGLDAKDLHCIDQFLIELPGAPDLAFRFR